MDNNGESRKRWQDSSGVVLVFQRLGKYFSFLFVTDYTCSSPTRKEQDGGERGKEEKEDPEDDLGGFY